MRPPEFTGGNGPWRPVRFGCAGSRFNEAAGIHWRKTRPSPLLRACVSAPGFNEAAGIHRRKLVTEHFWEFTQYRASMRPPEFTGGKLLATVGLPSVIQASMRPPEFTGGNF